MAFFIELYFWKLLYFDAIFNTIHCMYGLRLAFISQTYYISQVIGLVPISLKTQQNTAFLTFMVQLWNVFVNIIEENDWDIRRLDVVILKSILVGLLRLEVPMILTFKMFVFKQSWIVFSVEWSLLQKMSFDLSISQLSLRWFFGYC